MSHIEVSSRTMPLPLLHPESVEETLKQFEVIEHVIEDGMISFSSDCGFSWLIKTVFDQNGDVIEEGDLSEEELVREAFRPLVGDTVTIVIENQVYDSHEGSISSITAYIGNELVYSPRADNFEQDILDAAAKILAIRAASA